MPSWKEIRRAWKTDVALAQSRAQTAVGAAWIVFGVNALLAAMHTITIAAIAPHSDDVMPAITPSMLSTQRLLHIAAGFGAFGAVVLLVRWLRVAIALAQSMSDSSLRWTKFDATWGFFLPVLNLVRPYQILRDLHALLRPDGVGEPAPRMEVDGKGGYRSMRVRRAPLPGPLSKAEIGTWWTLHLLAALTANFGIRGDTLEQLETELLFAALFAGAAAALSVRMIRAIDQRLAERYRRVKHASNAELDEWGIQR